MNSTVENVIVAIIAVAAFAFLLNRGVKVFKNNDQCASGDGCGGCSCHCEASKEKGKD